VEPDDKRPPVTKDEKPPVVGGVGPVGGMDPAALSQASWSDKSGGGGSIKFEYGRLEMASPNDPEAEAQTFLSTPLRGDFDLVIDYRLENWKLKGEGQAQWDVIVSSKPKTAGENYMILGRRTGEEGDLFAVEPWSGAAGEETKAATPGGGKVRIVRKGASWTVSQWDGQVWKALTTFESTQPQELYLGFSLSVGGNAEAAKVSVQLSGGK